MSKFIKKFKRSLAIVLSVTTFAWALGPVALLLPTQVLAATAQAGDLIKMDGLASVYYLGADSKRYVFPNETTFNSWYSDFSSVKTIAQSELESYSLGSNATIRPGTKLVKITTDPKVYAVETGGILKWIPDEATAITLYGADWAKRVVDVPDAFFTNYTVSTKQVSATAYPEGTLIKYAGSSDINLVTSATAARKFASMSALTANRYKESDIVTAPATITYTAGAGITAAESTLVDLSSTGVTPGVTTTAGTGLTVALSSATAASGTIITGQAVADLGSFNFAAGTDGDVKVTTFKVKRGGVSADATLTNVYLYDGTTRLTDNASVSSGYITWANSSGIFTVSKGMTKTISVKSDIASDASGQTVSVSIQAASDITTDGATISGTFPVATNVMSVASATLAGVTLAVDTTPAGTPTVDPQDGYTMWSNSINFGTRAVYLNSLTFRQIGSVLKDDLKNFKLYISGIQVGDTAASVDANGYITFKPAAPYKIETGSREVKVIGDIVGGSSRNFILSLRRAADAIFVDSEYNANVLITGNANGATTAYAYAAHDSGTITINSGVLAITKATDSPTGNIINNGSQVVLGKFQLKATGESMKVENLRINYAASDNVTDNDNGTKELRNGALFYNGKQVGSTADIMEDSYSTTYTEYSLGSSVIVVPGTPGILEVKADVYDGQGTTNHCAAGDTILVNVAAGSSNVQRQTSLGYISNTAVVANTMTIAEGSLVLSKDQNYGSQSVVAPTTATKLAQFTLNTGTTEAVNLNTLTVDLTFANAFVAADLTNVYVKYGAKETSAKSTVSATSGANTWSINESMLANANMTIEIYGDVATAATDGGTDDTVIANLKVTGTTANSGATVNTNSSAVLAGQTITATGAGTLTVQLADDTPAAYIAVAGTQPTDGSIKLKLTSAREVIYVKTLTFRSNVEASDAVLASADLYAGSAGNLTKINGNKTFNIDGSKPGYFSWTLSGTDRIQVPKDGTTYVVVKPTYVSSAQVAIAGQTPSLFLADLEAEGASVLTPSSATPNLTIDTGVILSAGGSTAFVDSTKTLGAAVSSATATSLTCTTGDVFSAGDVIFVDTYNASGVATPDSKYNAAYEELMVVLADGTTALTVDRGAFGTTANATYEITDKIYLLNGAASNVNSIRGNAVTILKTKSKVTLASDSPSGSATGGTQKVIYKFTVTAESNSLDSAENKVSLTQLDLTATKSGTTVKNLKIYPADFDQNATYAVTASALSSTEWRLDMDSMAGYQYQILEGASKSYVVRADIGSGTNASNSLDVSIASIASGGDVTWSDGTTNTNWVDQPGATYISGSALTYGASSGTADTVAPTISTIVAANVATADSIAATDKITITFAEMIDPTTINASLVPGSSVTDVAAASTGGVTGLANGVITVTGITTFDAGSIAADISFTTTLALDTTGTILTITLKTGTTQVVTLSMGTGTTVAGTVKDVNGTAMAAVTSVLPTGSF